MEKLKTIKEINEINTFEIDKNTKTNSKGSKCSKSSESSFRKEELFTLEELRNKSNEILEEANKECKILNDDKYDLNADLNYFNIKQTLQRKDITEQDKIKSFNQIMYKLTYKNRDYLLKKYKNLFKKDEIQKKNPEVKIRQTKNLKEVFISLLNALCKYKEDTIKKLFKTKYYIETQTSNIPFLEGSEEFVYANMINDTYDTFIVKSNLPTNEKDQQFDEKFLSNIINDNDKLNPTIESIDIIEDKKENKETKIEEENNIQEIKKDQNNFYHRFYSKKNLLKNILEKYCSKELQKKRDELLQENPKYNEDKRIKYIYEIIIEALFFYCLYINETGKINIISHYEEIFYETEKEKLDVINNFDFKIEIKDIKDENKINLSYGLRNIDYNVIIEGYSFIFNLYDYNIKYLFDALNGLDTIQDKDKKQYIENQLNNFKFWTIQKHAKVNCLYNDNELNNAFKNEVEIMLKHKVVEKVFNEINMFDGYIYPLSKEGFLKQIKNSILYIKLPTTLILGLTLKKLGVIIINKGRFDEMINRQKDKNKKYILKLGEFAFYKVTMYHEINFHYFLVILFSNKKINFLNTPKKVFKNYTVHAKIDFGYKGEVMLFGNKVSVLYIEAIKNIINLEFWNHNINDIPYNIGKKFLDINKEKKDDCKISNLINLSNFTNILYKIIENDNYNNIHKFNLDLNVGNVFTTGKILDININNGLEIANFNNGIILFGGYCLNNFII